MTPPFDRDDYRLIADIPTVKLQKELARRECNCNSSMRYAGVLCASCKRRQERGEPIAE